MSALSQAVTVITVLVFNGGLLHKQVPNTPPPLTPNILYVGCEGAYVCMSESICMCVSVCVCMCACMHVCVCVGADQLVPSA